MAVPAAEHFPQDSAPATFGISHVDPSHGSQGDSPSLCWEPDANSLRSSGCVASARGRRWKQARGSVVFAASFRRSALLHANASALKVWSVEGPNTTVAENTLNQFTGTPKIFEDERTRILARGGSVIPFSAAVTQRPRRRPAKSRAAGHT
jgi:hypothetical protein